MTTPNNEQDPLWKQIWKTEGIRYLGDKLPEMPDAMERFKHAFELGQLEEGELSEARRKSLAFTLNEMNRLEAEVERLRETLEFIATDDAEARFSTGYYRAIANKTLRLITK